MKHHLDYGLRLQAAPKNKSFYKWAINEVDEKGVAIGQDQIPWPWTLTFSAKSCLVVDSFEIEKQLSASLENTRTVPSEYIHFILRPGRLEGQKLIDDVAFFMFGTNREIKHFVLQMRPTKTSSYFAKCSAWGGVSYTDVTEFQQKRTDDSIWSGLSVELETFLRYKDIINSGRIENIILRLEAVSGFYSEWSPSVRTRSVKVLAGKEHNIDIPAGFSIEPPRLGSVGNTRLQIERFAEMRPTDRPSLAKSTEIIPTLPAAKTQPFVQVEPQLYSHLASMTKLSRISIVINYLYNVNTFFAPLIGCAFNNINLEEIA